MASHGTPGMDTESDFSFGVRELRQANAAPALALAGDAAPRPSVKERRGFDPYNTSGSFDRKTHWARVGKR